VSQARGRAALGRGEAWCCFFVASLLDIANGWRNFPDVLRGGMLRGALLNPDSYMRMVRLDDMLAAGRPLHAVMRDASGAGTLLHWSHCLDLVLLAMALPLRLLLSWHDALHVAAVLFGPLAMGIAGVAAAWVVAPLSAGTMRWMAAAMVGLAPTVLAYGFPGVVHHHVPLGIVVLLLAGLAGRLAGGDRDAGRWLGAVAALGIWLSPETMPFIMLAFGGGGLAWALAQRPGRDGGATIAGGLAWAGVAFLGLTLLFWLLDPPAGGYGEFVLYRLSGSFVVLAAIVAAACGVLVLLPGRPVTGLAVAAAGIVLWVALFPAVLHGTDDVAQDAPIMMAGIREMMPVSSLAEGVTYLIGGVLALAVCAWLAWRERSWMWAYATATMLAPITLGALHIRFATYDALAGAACLPLALAAVNRALADRPDRAALARVGLLALAVLTTRADSFAAMLGVAPAVTPMRAACSLEAAVGLLAPYSGSVVLTEVNDVPELLYRAPVRTVGSLYINVPAFLRLRAAWRAVPGAVPGAAFDATGASLVLVCPGGPRSVMVQDVPPTTLLDRLRGGDAPGWLNELGREASGYVLYGVRR
jgi:hypothetical protein